jgi:YHS domain-containing protein
VNQSEPRLGDAANVAVHKHDQTDGPHAGSGGAPAYIDPVCGMPVSASSDKAVNYQASTYYFCSDPCKVKFSDNPTHFVKSKAAPVSTSRETSSGPVPPGVVYTCPMHPEIRQIGPGTCPKCGMTLEPLVGAGAEDTSEIDDMSCEQACNIDHFSIALSVVNQYVETPVGVQTRRRFTCERLAHCGWGPACSCAIMS